MNKQRMLKLADFLDNLPTKKFDFREFRDAIDGVPELGGCGAVGCAIGWMPAVFPVLCKSWIGEKTSKGFTLRKNGDFFTRAAEVLDIARWHTTDLFSPGSTLEGLRPESLSENTTPKAVANRIRQFVKKYPTSKYAE